ncbi:MAG: hypothetical protein RL885_06645 [Planctomycetota bacterium]
MTRLQFWLGVLILMTFLLGLTVGKLASEVGVALESSGSSHRDSYASLLVERLELDLEQEKRLVKILNEYAEKERAAWKTYQDLLYREHKELRKIQSDLRQRTEREILQILDPIQRQKWRLLSRSTR